LAAPVTLASIRGQALLRADAVNNPFFTTAEVNQYINNSYAELYDLLTGFPDSEWNLQQYYFKTTYLNQAIGTGTAAGAVTFTATLPGAGNQMKGTLTIYNNGAVATDNGSGTISAISGTGNPATGTINYTSGAISVTFTTAPVPGSCISVSYVGTYSTTDTYNLPSNHYKARGLDLQIGQTVAGTQYVSIRSFMFMERNQYNYLYNPIAISILGGTNLLYRIIGSSSLKLIPTPNIANLNFRLWYIPTYTAMVSDTDTMDGVDGWEEYVIVDTVIKMMAKQETDTTPWDIAKAGLIKRIEAMAANRDVGNPQRVADTVQGQSNGPFMIGGLPF
jgi:hypothetical protein